MRKETSFGIIPLRKEGNVWKVFLVRHQAGHWSFPKGHKEKDESDEECATRELQEETGLGIIRFLSCPTLSEHYSFWMHKERVSKTVTYFLAEVKGEVCIQSQELSGGDWFTLQQAEKCITFEEAKKIGRKVQQFLKDFE